MSLVSRVTNLFGTTATTTDSSTQTNTSSVPATDSAAIRYESVTGTVSPSPSSSARPHYDTSEPIDSRQTKRLRTKERLMDGEHDEHDFRPPYLHVRILRLFLALFCGDGCGVSESMLTGRICF